MEGIRLLHAVCGWVAVQGSLHAVCGWVAMQGSMSVGGSKGSLHAVCLWVAVRARCMLSVGGSYVNDVLL